VAREQTLAGPSTVCEQYTTENRHTEHEKTCHTDKIETTQRSKPPGIHNARFGVTRSSAPAAADEESTLNIILCDTTIDLVNRTS